jgi:membrane protease YdiL (CAAX protease family)
MSSQPGYITPVKRPLSWPLFGIIVALGMFGVLMFGAASFLSGPPTQETLAQAGISIPLPLLIALQMAQNLILIGLLSLLGLLAATRTGLGLPFIEGALKKEAIWGQLPRIAGLAAGIGVVGAAVIAMLDQFVFNPYLLEAAESAGVDLANAGALTPSPLHGFFLSFYGGITEEVLLRLGVFSMLAWLISRIPGARAEDGRPTLATFWIAGALAALLFGAGHLPTAIALGIAGTPLLVARIILLNSLLGIAFAWLYWTRGLEAAIISHFAADIILHVLLPALAG